MPSIAARPIDNPRIAALAVIGVSAFMLAFALISQHVFGLRPCELCYWQRWPYWAALIFGGLALLARGRQALLALLAAALVFAVGAGIALFHVGVEYGWWQGLAACAGLGEASNVEQLRQQLLGSRPVRCDEPAFVFLGLSMAGWNFVLSLLYAVLAASFALRNWRKQA